LSYDSNFGIRAEADLKTGCNGPGHFYRHWVALQLWNVTPEGALQKRRLAVCDDGTLARDRNPASLLDGALRVQGLHDRQKAKGSTKSQPLAAKPGHFAILCVLYLPAIRLFWPDPEHPNNFGPQAFFSTQCTNSLESIPSTQPENLT
jgi:hypothetical protein